MPVVSITRLRVRSWRFLPQFFYAVVRTDRQAKGAAGNGAVKLLRDRDNVFWTATLWESEAAMRQYMITGLHGKVMPKLMEWCDEASVVHWAQESTSLPDWQEAHRRMQSEGRPSKVRHPSPAQQRFEIPEPKG